MVGLDAAGKTTILYKLKLGEIVTTIPTIGKRLRLRAFLERDTTALRARRFATQARAFSCWIRPHVTLGCSAWGEARVHRCRVPRAGKRQTKLRG